MSSHEDPGCGVNVAAYALGALEPAEAEGFERHLETCAICREELAEFQPIVNALPLTAPQLRAPRSLRRRVMGEVRAQGEAGSPARSRRRVTPSLLPRAGLAVATGVALILIVVVALVSTGGPSAPRTRTYAAQVTGPGTARLTVTGEHGELIVRHFAPPPKGKIYEVWLARPHHAPAPTSALFSVTRNGSGDVTVPGNLRGVTQVMVTPEPAGGSRVPTHAAVISARI